PSSKELIEKMARGKQYALVMEPARANGAIVSARRGGGSYTLTVKGKASHSGVAPEEGISAIKELAHKIIKLENLNDHEAGIAINVRQIHGEAAANMKPDEAYAEIDVIISKHEQIDIVAQQIKESGTMSKVQGTKLKQKRSINRPPLEINEQNKK